MPLTNTSEQLAVITAPVDRHIKVPAVAGSGKSHTLRYRIQFLLSEGVAPGEIMVFMFNKSAQLAFERDLKALGLPALPKVKTFDAYALALCKELMANQWLIQAELNSSERDYKTMCRDALLQVVDNKGRNNCNPYSPSVIDEFSGFIGLVKSNAVAPIDLFKTNHYDHEYIPFIKGFQVFEQQRAKKKVRFFADLLYDAVNCLNHNDTAKAAIENRLSHVLIDEYQDINETSQQLIKYLAGQRAKVTVVGDDDQTLYQFRGAKPEYLIQLFDQDFADPLVFPLTKTFRYGHSVSLMANNVIANNQNRFDKMSVSAPAAPATDIMLYVDNQNSTSPNSVIRAIQEWIADGGQYQDVAILLRVFSFSPILELSLLTNDIPYRLEGHSSILSSVAVDFMISALLLRSKSHPLTAEKTTHLILQVLRYPNPMVNRENLQQIAQSILNPEQDTEALVLDLCQRHPASAKKHLITKCEAIADIIAQHTTQPPGVTLNAFLEASMFTSQLESVAQTPIQYTEQLAIIQSFIQFVNNHETDEIGLSRIVANYLTDIAVRTSDDSILLTSVHRAKGLAWPLVIVPALSEDSFPFKRDDKPVDMDAERRLFYVAITRAKARLALIAPNDPVLAEVITNHQLIDMTKIHHRPTPASRFLYEANLLTAITVGKVIEAENIAYPIEPTDSALLVNQYLAKLGLSLRVNTRD